MKNSLLFSLILAIVVLGGLGLFYLESKLSDADLVNRDINIQFLTIDSLDSDINELALRSRANLDLNYDMLVRSTVSLERAVDQLSDGYFNQQKIAGSLLEKRFDDFNNLIEVKLDQVEDFKSSNSVLRNSEKYTPIVGTQLAEIAKQNRLLEISDHFNKIVLDVQEFTKQGSSKSLQDIAEYPRDIRRTESELPSSSLTKILEFAKHVETAMASKLKTDGYLNQLLNSSTGDGIQEVSSVWGIWQSENNSARTTLRYYTLAYILIVFALIGWLVFRLRSLYKNLDQQVEAKTREVKVAYEDLHASERQLVQSEKMASLGQLVAGVVHEINTPLSYITSNMETIDSRLSQIEPVIERVGDMSVTLSDPNRDKNIMGKLLKEQIVAYRNLGKKNTPSNIKLLISDASVGLQKIKEIVQSLSNFSHVQELPLVDVDVNECLTNTLKITTEAIGERRIETGLSDDLPVIKGVYNQLVQVFTNMLTNAISATDPSSGIISIETKILNNSIQVMIRDNGCGIDPTLIKRVFEPFYTTKELGEGSGLGLSISERIINANGGDLKIESQLNEGTLVVISLPLTK